MTTNQVTTATNLQGPDLSFASAVNNANKYFNNFYNTGFAVSAGANDAITGFFEQYSPNPQAAKQLASAVLYTALAQNLDPLKVLSEFEALPKGQLNTYLVAFLNTTREPTSVLGINHGTKTSPYITRAILI
jgi:hypothetical protein